MNYIFFSSSAFGIPALEMLSAQYGTPTIIVTKPAVSAGRGRIVKETVICTWGKAHHVTILQPKKTADAKFLNALRHSHPDIFFIASYGNILPPALLKIPRHGTLNIHPSLLPRFRGPSPVQATILSGEALTGVSLMLTDRQMDHGPIIAQKPYTITNPHVTAPQLEKTLAELGAEILLASLPGWMGSTLIAKEQEHDKATFTRFITKKDGHINWSEAAVALERKIRAYQPWPNAYTFWQQIGAKRIRLQLLDSSVIPAPPDAKPGTVSAHEHTAVCAQAKGAALAVVTGDGALCVITLKPEGKKEMFATAFLAGHPDIIGAILS